MSSARLDRTTVGGIRRGGVSVGVTAPGLQPRSRTDRFPRFPLAALRLLSPSVAKKIPLRCFSRCRRTVRPVRGPGKSERNEMTQQRRCRACKRLIPPHPSAGRPRIFCVACVPPGAGAAGTAAWRAVNPERVAAYNAARRR